MKDQNIIFYSLCSYLPRVPILHCIWQYHLWYSAYMSSITLLYRKQQLQGFSLYYVCYLMQLYPHVYDPKRACVRYNACSDATYWHVDAECDACRNADVLIGWGGPACVCVIGSREVQRRSRKRNSRETATLHRALNWWVFAHINTRLISRV